MKYLLLLTTIFLSACGSANRAGASLTGYSEFCIKGVMYYQFTSGVTVAYMPEGEIRGCSK